MSGQISFNLQIPQETLSKMDDAQILQTLTQEVVPVMIEAYHIAESATQVDRPRVRVGQCEINGGVSIKEGTWHLKVDCSGDL